MNTKEFNEIFKLIFAEIWDEKEALENRANKVVESRKAIDPQITHDRINNLFQKACDEWPGIFKQREDIELAQRHLQVCVGPIEGVPYIYPKDIRRFLIPSILQALRVKIHNLLIQSHEKDKESKRLLEQAKTRVEQLIEEAVQS